MKIYPIADWASDWYPKNALLLFKQHSRFEFVASPHQADLVWIFSHYVAPAATLTLPPSLLHFLPSAARRRRVLSHLPIVTTIHHLTPAKKHAWLPTLRLLDCVTDFWQTFSPLNVPYFKKFMIKPIYVLPYWIDSTQFYPLPAPQRRELRTKYKLPPDKTIIGSFQRDTEQDLRTPKLEKGPDIFCDIVERLDHDKILILLAGPRRNYIEQRLSAQGIPYRSLGKTPYSTMNNLYNILDYYLVTSRYEGGPQAILETMATRTKIFSTRVGVSDLLSPPVIFSDTKQCLDMLSQPYPDVLAEHYQKVSSLNCQNVIPQYEQFFKKIAKEYATAHPISV